MASRNLRRRIISDVADNASVDVWVAIMSRIGPDSHADAARLACVNRATASAKEHLAPQYARGVRTSPLSGRVHPPLGGDTAFDVVMEPGEALTVAAVGRCPPGGCILLAGVEYLMPATTFDLSEDHRVHIFGRPATVFRGVFVSRAACSTVSGIRFSRRPPYPWGGDIPRGSLGVEKGGLRIQDCIFDGCNVNIYSRKGVASVADCTFRDCGDRCIYVVNTKSVSLRDNVITGAKEHGVFIGSGCSQVTMEGNTFEGNAVGISMEHDVCIDGTRPNVFRDNGQDYAGQGRVYDVLYREHLAHMKSRRAEYLATAARLLAASNTIRDPPHISVTFKPKPYPSLAHELNRPGSRARDGDNVLLQPGVYRVDGMCFSRNMTFFGRGLVTLFTQRPEAFKISADVAFVGVRFVHACRRTADPAFCSLTVADGGHLALQSCEIESDNIGIFVDPGASVSAVASRVGRVFVGRGPARRPSFFAHSSIDCLAVSGGGTRVRLRDCDVRGAIAVEDGANVSASGTPAPFVRAIVPGLLPVPGPGEEGCARVVSDGRRLFDDV